MHIEGFAFLILLPYIEASDDFREKLWPDAIVQYDIHYYLNDDERFRNTFYTILNRIETNTCIRFLRKRPENLAGYALFVPMGYSLFRYQYRPGYEEDNLILLRLPYTLKSILREILRILGIRFEHVRRERDKYITVFQEHVISQCSSGKYPITDMEDCMHYYDWYGVFFKKVDSWPPHGISYPPYTLNTVMHFEPHEFSTGGDAIVVKCEQMKRPNMYFDWAWEYEIDRINALYNAVANSSVPACYSFKFYGAYDYCY